MRRILTFLCEGSTLAATLDEAAGTTGLLIVSGGNEIRIGAHRGMANLAADIAAEGHPVFRFDRRGIGDSEGSNGEFESSAADIEAAVNAFRQECPALTAIVAFGNCDAAAALALHRPAVDALVIANPWVIEPQDGLPPPAAIRARYAERLRDPKTWVRFFNGAISFRKLFSGLARIVTPEVPSDLASRVAAGLTDTACPITILLASRDGTAIAFADQWEKPAFVTLRKRQNVTLEQVDSASHSFANEADYRALRSAIISAML